MPSPLSGDIDQVLTYGARSFTILDQNGNMVFDSGGHLEQVTALQTPALFNADNGDPALIDTRSDNKGPEPEGITVGSINGKTYAFLGLERAGGGVMVYDVTDPSDVSFTQYARNDGDVSPEGLTFISAGDSPIGEELLAVTNEVSNTMTLYAVTSNVDYTLQLLHLSDGEAGLLAPETAPKLAALVDAFDDDFANTLILSGGDNFIPGPFLAAGTDLSVIPALNAATGSTIGATSNIPFGAIDIAILNSIGVEASTLGNHEFDLSSRVLRDAFRNADPDATNTRRHVPSPAPFLSSPW